jgi:hypothetical protein
VVNFVCLFIARRVEGDPVDDIENVSEHEDPMEPKLERPTE